MIVLENLVLDKGYSLKNKAEQQSLECAQFAIKTLAKHHAIAHVMIAENGGPQKFFKIFPNLDLESFDKPFMMNLLKGMCDNAVLSNIKILEKNLNIFGAKETAENLKQFVGKPMSIVLDAIKIPDERDNFFVLGHGYKIFTVILKSSCMNDPLK